MAKRIGKYTVITENKPSVLGYASVAGKKESEGPLRDYFDITETDTTFGEETWEKAEAKLQKLSSGLAIEKAGVSKENINYAFAGDLLNQCISSSFGLRDLNIPFLGQYGACSTMAQTIAMASSFVEGEIANMCLAVTSSHFCSAERQYRFPLEYGGQRTPTAQWTVTGSGALVIGHHTENKPYINAFTIGKIMDLGIKDANNMGAAMAPAAADTLLNFLNDTETEVSDYDLIATGDLGFVGAELFCELLEKENIKFTHNYKDCGLLIFDREKQDVHAGGSGCGCSASVLCSYILKRMEKREYKNILFLATGAMMSPTSTQQGNPIPCIANLINFKI